MVYGLARHGSFLLAHGVACHAAASASAPHAIAARQLKPLLILPFTSVSTRPGVWWIRHTSSRRILEQEGRMQDAVTGVGSKDLEGQEGQEDLFSDWVAPPEEQGPQTRVVQSSQKPSLKGVYPKQGEPPTTYDFPSTTQAQTPEASPNKYAAWGQTFDEIYGGGSGPSTQGVPSQKSTVSSQQTGREGNITSRTLKGDRSIETRRRPNVDTRTTARSVDEPMQRDANRTITAFPRRSSDPSVRLATPILGSQSRKGHAPNQSTAKQSDAKTTRNTQPAKTQPQNKQQTSQPRVEATKGEASPKPRSVVRPQPPAQEQTANAQIDVGTEFAALYGPNSVTLRTGRKVTLPSVAYYIPTLEQMQWFINRCRMSRSLYFDAEGHRLSRNGTLDILAIYPGEQSVVGIIPVHKLGDKVFSMRSTLSNVANKSLREMFADRDVAKIAWDIRCDANALFWRHNIRFENAIDAQILEALTRRDSRKAALMGLGAAVNQLMELTQNAKKEFVGQKDRCITLFSPEFGGSFDVFRETPLRQELIAYCANDVRYLPLLAEEYKNRVSHNREVWQKVQVATLHRISDVMSPDWKPGFRNDGESPAWNSFASGWDAYEKLRLKKTTSVSSAVRTRATQLLWWCKWWAKTKIFEPWYELMRKRTPVQEDPKRDDKERIREAARLRRLGAKRKM